ncbi:hypothetical protein MNBD_ALPHA06-112 [hydrothermal vent metagenome]|uniref:Outer membrane lipoprotein-sorting protein n=1 Tax=hydrothermal vent metagenome TaxID=652676 RepID=A0A3B0RN44_9ZZZZ
MVLAFTRKISIALLVVAVMAPFAWANASLPERVEHALEILEARNDNAPRFSFERETYKKGIKTELKVFDPTRPVPERWQVAFPSMQDDPKENAKLQKKYAKWDGKSDTALMIPDLRKRMGNGAVFVRTEKDADVFSFDIADEYILEGGGRKSEIARYIKGEIAIDTKTNLIRWIRYYAPNEFKPLSVVKLKFYEIIQYVAPAWENGPFVRVYETSKVNGSAPFTTITVDEVMINENMAPVRAGSGS